MSHAAIHRPDRAARVAERLFGRLAGPYRDFRNDRLTWPDWSFGRSYELLRDNFDPSELEPRSHYTARLRAAGRRRGDPPPIMIGRFSPLAWRYPLIKRPPEAVAVICGDYLSLRDAGRPGAGIGAIGHLVTASAHRRGAGHGTALVAAFEQATARAAASRGERLRLILLESRDSARPFWARRGYRELAEVRYAQPPLGFDRQTGAPQQGAVPETLMVKAWGDSESPGLERDLLVASVRALYERWYLPDARDYAPAACSRIADVVLGQVFGDFLASLPDGVPVVPFASGATG